jgi:membrane-associated HD superfamily phosphohydrolase
LTTSLARFLSVVFHPLLMPTVLFGILLFQVPNAIGLDAFSGSLRLSLLVLIFIGTFAVPSLLIYYLVRSGYVQSMQLDNLADRRVPYFLTTLVYGVLTYLFAFHMQGISVLAPEIPIFLGSMAVSILLVGIISLSWQISAHAVGFGGVIGSLGSLMVKFSLTDLFIPVLLVVLLAGFVTSARLKLNAHTPSQVGAGLLVGLTVSLATVFWLV